MVSWWATLPLKLSMVASHSPGGRHNDIIGNRCGTQQDHFSGGRWSDPQRRAAWKQPALATKAFCTSMREAETAALKVVLQMRVNIWIGQTINIKHRCVALFVLKIKIHPKCRSYKAYKTGSVKYGKKITAWLRSAALYEVETKY